MPLTDADALNPRFDYGDPRPATVMVRFGNGPDQSMPLAWAEHMLNDLASRHPATFKKLLASAALA
jgi:hypothetical protein